MSVDEQTLITAPVREVAGVALPAVGTYVLDSSHSHVGFTVKHLMVAKVRGSLAGVAATIVVAEDILQSSVSVEIDASNTRPGRSCLLAFVPMAMTGRLMEPSRLPV